MTDHPIPGQPGRLALRVSRRSLLAVGALATLTIGGDHVIERGLAGWVRSTRAGDPSGDPAPSPSGERAEVTIYLVSVAPNRLGPQLRPWPATVFIDPADRRVAAAALSALLEGPDNRAREDGFVSAIPEGIEVVSAELSDDDPAVVRVELSPGWLATDDDRSDEAASDRVGPAISLDDRLATPAAGQAGSVAERDLRLRAAQVVFTLTQFDTIDAVEFLLDRETLGALSNLGAVIEDGPVDRLRFDDLVPLIMIEGPLAYDTVGPTFDVYGSSNTFESSLMLRLESADGETLFEEPQTATSGNGVRGTFSASVTVPDDTPAGPLTLVGFEVSARDGSEVNVFEVPLRYAP
ncbi:MAG TPA: Gmad2 immunoglobulin-like domain-containing protein [Thermomicrobiales bacterium]|jgi:hypothetical protein|nr:Gmad2 immunoglobulin-like domain-containing protein [Thermomicrobiales bacterium]